MLKSKSLLEIVKQDAVELCTTIGFMLKKSTDLQDPLYMHMPFSLFPTPFPAELFRESLELQLPLGLVVAGIVADP